MRDIQDPYCYPGTEVLINKLDIRDETELFKAEKVLSMLRLLELMQLPVTGSFDLRHLCAIHEFIFQDLYSWAGKIRTVDIGKGNLFCHAEYIEKECVKLFSDLKDETPKLKYESSNPEFTRNRFINRCSYYFSEINAIHPFREGNGRVQREFVRAWAIKCGFKLEFSKVSRTEMLTASRESFVCNYAPMEDIFKKITAPIKPEI